ncbi:predicted protein [Sclerotinia sclerotiorum 1980 UF-70]|uniref:Uncharacterized protein n=1 Tax=Sclerotinia sclerotiorum (strain ATCC 18683 / 1980 / Ss-1) TaxID=665079 RepID=A7E7X2_SCLS1|nr:predicted protein [Sclerotinia sclerotiorum 1980 UF-70]EDN96474.1 predicted protein [Sclerotinia sclerotiorum 1980 UF-70]
MGGYRNWNQKTENSAKVKQMFEKLVTNTLKIFGDNTSKRKTEAEPEAVQLNAGCVSDQSFIIRSFAPNRDRLQNTADKIQLGTIHKLPAMRIFDRARRGRSSTPKSTPTPGKASKQGALIVNSQPYRSGLKDAELQESMSILRIQYRADCVR